MSAARNKLKSLQLIAAQAEKEKGWAWEHHYEVRQERDLLIRALSKVYPSHLMRHRRNANKKPVVAIQTPAGQLCWTLPDDEFALKFYRHLKWTENDWDGHRTADRYARLESL